MSVPPTSRSGGPERRRAPRAPADLSIEFAPSAPGQPAGVARLRDISTLGLSCLAPRAVPEMTKVQVAIELPGAPGQQSMVEAEGAVVRCEPASRPAEGFEIAVYFTRIAPGHRDSIHGFVNARLAR